MKRGVLCVGARHGNNEEGEDSKVDEEQGSPREEIQTIPRPWEKQGQFVIGKNETISTFITLMVPQVNHTIISHLGPFKKFNFTSSTLPSCKKRCNYTSMHDFFFIQCCNALFLFAYIIDVLKL